MPELKITMSRSFFLMHGLGFFSFFETIMARDGLISALDRCSAFVKCWLSVQLSSLKNTSWLMIGSAGSKVIVRIYILVCILILGTIIIHYWHPHSSTIDSAQISIHPGIWPGRAYMLWVPKQTAHAVPQRHRWLVIKSQFFSSKPYLSMKFWRSP